MNASDRIVLALPKGRILKEVSPLLSAVGIEPEADFFDDNSRKLRFETSDPALDIIRVRSFDVATFVAFGGAQLGVVGSDVLMEFDYPDLYAPLDLGISPCRLSVAALREVAEKEDPQTWSQVRVATKYPNLTRKHFAQRGVHAECIKLHGAMELAPSLGLCRRIVDLVASGQTLKENGMEEIEVIAQVSSRLCVNRAAWKLMPERIAGFIDRFSMAVADAAKAA